MTDAPRPQEFEAATLTSFADAARLVERFEQILDSHGIAVAPGSDLESVCLDVMELEHLRRRDSRLDPMTDVRPILGQAAGWVDFLKLLVCAENGNRLAAFIPHLQLLNSAREVTQNTRLPVSDEASNKLFELFVALLCVQVSNDVTLAPPNDSGGENPDVLARINGRLWGFACKVINGLSPITLFDRFEEGLQQIEDSPADTGFVFFNFKNIVDHRQAWPLLNEEAFSRREEEPIFGAWPDASHVLAQLNGVLNERWQALVNVNGPAEVVRLVQGKRVMPAAAVYMATATAIRSSTGPLPTLVGQLGQLRILEMPAKGERVLRLMNRVLHGKRKCTSCGKAVVVVTVTALLGVAAALIMTRKK